MYMTRDMWSSYLTTADMANGTHDPGTHWTTSRKQAQIFKTHSSTLSLLRNKDGDIFSMVRHGSHIKGEQREASANSRRASGETRDGRDDNDSPTAAYSHWHVMQTNYSADSVSCFRSDTEHVHTHVHSYTPPVYTRHAWYTTVDSWPSTPGVSGSTLSRFCVLAAHLTHTSLSWESLCLACLVQ